MPATRDQREVLSRLRMKLASYLGDLPEHARSAQHAGDLAFNLIQLRDRLSEALETIRREDAARVAREFEALYVRDADELANIESRADIVVRLTQIWLEAVERTVNGEADEEREFVGAGVHSVPQRWRDL